MTTPDQSREVTIIGAGLAGSLLAVYLARRGVRVTMYEKRPDLRRVDISAGRSINLALANRGIEALRAVGLMDLVDPLLIPMAGRMLHHPDESLQFVPYGNKPHEVIHSVSRGGLNGILMSAAEATGLVTIHFEHACRAVDLERKRITIATPSGDEERSFDLLIGSDGSASAVRSAIAEATGGKVEEEPLDHGYKELSIPPGGSNTFRMANNALHIWPRGEYMLIALPNTDGSFTVTLFLPNEGPESFRALDSAGKVCAFFSERFPDAVPLLPHLDEQFFGNPTGHLETVRAWPWAHESAVVIGDAAHAIVPFHGQGMNAAFEDCLELDRALDGASTWEEAFATFAERRKPDAEAIADMALENYVEMRDTVADPKFPLRKEIAFRLEERHPDRFIPRYSMVMFHRIPYAEAQRRGAVQESVLRELMEGRESIDEIDFERGDALVRERLEPFE